jgi:hypothetical protein
LWANVWGSNLMRKFLISAMLIGLFDNNRRHYSIQIKTYQLNYRIF